VNAVVAAAAAGLAAGVTLIAATIVARRLVGGVHRRRRIDLRPGIELALATFLVDEDAEDPAPETRAERHVFRAVALEALTELRGTERARLAALLVRLGFADEAIPALGARRRSARRQAAEALALIGGADTVSALRDGLTDRDAIVRGTCARGLAENDAAGDIVGTILRALERDAVLAPGGAAAVVLALGGHRPAAVGRLLAPNVGPELRVLAAAVAGELRLSEHAPLLRACVEDDDDELAARAARGLGLIGDSEAVPQLLEALRDNGRSADVRVASAGALGSIGDVTAVRALEWQLRESGWSLRASAARGLALLGSPGVDALRRALDSKREDVRAQAYVALES
jgi:HEAT repeat protein